MAATSLQDLQVVEGNDGHQVDDRLRCAAAVGDRYRRIGGTHLVGCRLDRHQQCVVMAVIAGLDLDQPVASGESPRQANGVERRFGAAVGEAPLRLLEAAGELRRHHGVIGHRLGEVGAARGALVDRLDDQGVRVPHHHHPEAVVKVDVFVAVDVPDAAALPVIDEDRLGRGVLEGRGHPAGDDLPGLLPELIGSPALRPEALFLLGGQLHDAAGGDRLGNCTHGFPPRDFFTARAEIASSMQRLAFWEVISA